MYLSRTKYIFFSPNHFGCLECLTLFAWLQKRQVMVISLGSYSCDGIAQSPDCSPFCNARGKRVEEEMVYDNRCEGVEFLRISFRRKLRVTLNEFFDN